MLQEDPAYASIFFVPIYVREPRRVVQYEAGFGANAIHHRARTPLVIIVDLCGWSLQIAVMVEKLQSSQYRLRAGCDESHNVRGSEKTVPVHQSDDFPVTLDRKS